MTKLYDAFLSYNSSDKQQVAEIARWLVVEAKLTIWFDEWNLIPGHPIQEELENALASSMCCVFFLGQSGMGPWQNEEMRTAQAEQVSRRIRRVVPVLLPGSVRPLQESNLPGFLRRRAWVTFRKSKKDQDALLRLMCGIKGIPPGPHVAESSASASSRFCPYRGLEVFREEDKDIFFGRDSVNERLLLHLSNHRFLAILGPSGSGKSSVVQAGLLPFLRDGNTLVTYFTPRERPLEELAFSLHRIASGEESSEKIHDRLSDSKNALHFISRELIDAAQMRRLVIVIDQFEELFTHCHDEDECQHFQAVLLTAVERPTASTTVILTLRSDFLGKMCCISRS